MSKVLKDEIYKPYIHPKCAILAKTLRPSDRGGRGTCSALRVGAAVQKEVPRFTAQDNQLTIIN